MPPLPQRLFAKMLGAGVQDTLLLSSPVAICSNNISIWVLQFMINDSYCDNLNEIIEHCWHQLNFGATDRKHRLHTLNVANASPDGGVSQRIMVLREADSAKRLLRFHTDVRAAKCGMIGDKSPVSILGYDFPGKTQLRMNGSGWIDGDSAMADAAWEAAIPFSRRCYLADPAPGSITPHPISGLPSDLEGVEPTLERSEEGRKNFALLWVEITAIEWLYLAHTGHRRATFQHEPATDKWTGRWMVP